MRKRQESHLGVQWTIFENENTGTGSYGSSKIGLGTPANLAVADNGSNVVIWAVNGPLDFADITTFSRGNYIQLGREEARELAIAILKALP